MALLVYMDDVLAFSSGWDVILMRKSLEISAEELQTYVRVAFSHLDDPCLHDDRGPLFDVPGKVTYEQYLGFLREHGLKEVTKRAKLKYTRMRRTAFNVSRPDLVLAMIDAGILYLCTHPGCDAHEDLTVDHITPLSRGGSDDLSNLQFLCRPHNSSKRDRAGILVGVV